MHSQAEQLRSHTKPVQATARATTKCLSDVTPLLLLMLLAHVMQPCRGACCRACVELWRMDTHQVKTACALTSSTTTRLWASEAYN